MKFLDEAGARDAIKRGLATSSASEFAVAFWGDGAIAELGIPGRNGTLTVICNLSTGGTNPHVIESMIADGKSDASITVCQNDRLHAKVYLFDNFAIVGSSNASTNGLALERGELTHWSEANILIEDQSTLNSLRAWMRDLRRWEITDSDMRLAREAWKARRSSIRLPHDRSKTVLEALRFESASLAALKIYVAIYHDDLSEEGEKARTEIQKEWNNKKVDVFEDWRALPAEGILLSFLLRTEHFEFEGAWQRRGTAQDRKAAQEKNSLQVVWKVGDVFGKVPVRKDEMQNWHDICQLALQGQPTRKQGQALCLPLMDILSKGYLPEHLRPDSFETDVDKSIRDLENVLSRERERPVRLGRTHPKIARVGKQRTVADLILKKTASKGFKLLIDRRMANRTFEAVALRHPETFKPAVLERARSRLEAEGIDPKEYLDPK